ncbi:MAG: CRISPR-associated protein Cas5 [bacterium ADurb.Bin429]|nr:MAG: CRISPR-associated protein Cas5 [bacterium ADurb.Bin429]
MEYPPIQVKVWGPYACFTRPEMKVERVSYPVMTPSAARGVLEAIFWKPEFVWRVREIHVLAPIRHFSLLRNEVSARMSPRSQGLDIMDARTQRHTLGLQDPAYLIVADVVLRPGTTADAAKYRDQFRRRVERGQCYHRPYLGCREFAASFAKPDGGERALPLNEALGLMLLDLAYRKDAPAQPHFFPAELVDGVLHVPPYDFHVAGGAA